MSIIQLINIVKYQGVILQVLQMCWTKQANDSVIRIPSGVYMGPQSPPERRPSDFEAQACVTLITEGQC